MSRETGQRYCIKKTVNDPCSVVCLFSIYEVLVINLSCNMWPYNIHKLRNITLIHSSVINGTHDSVVLSGKEYCFSFSFSFFLSNAFCTLHAIIFSLAIIHTNRQTKFHLWMHNTCNKIFRSS